jgi:uncharacterized membrane protein
MRKASLAGILIVLLSFAMAAYFYSQLPELIPSHWNAAGQVDGYMPKLWGLFLFPLISGGLFLLFLAIPRMDPLKANLAQFRNYFDGFILIILGFMLYIQALALSWAMGYTFNFIMAMVPAFSLIFYYAGVLIQHAKQNWFIGIRTPWTMSNEKVWEKTHKLGAKLFKAAAIIGLSGLLLQEYAILLVILPAVTAGAYSIVYSYLEYQKETRPRKR